MRSAFDVLAFRTGQVIQPSASALERRRAARLPRLILLRRGFPPPLPLLIRVRTRAVREGCADAGSCGREAAWPYGFCERCGELYEEQLDRLIEELATIVGEIDRRFPGLFAELMDEHLAALPAHLAAHYRPGDDWLFVLPSIA